MAELGRLATDGVVSPEQPSQTENAPANHASSATLLYIYPERSSLRPRSI